MRRLQRVITILLMFTFCFGTLPCLQAKENLSYQGMELPKLIKSGQYQYCVISEEKKTAALYRIDSSESNIVIPKMIDGYTIVHLGTQDKIGAEPENVNVMGENKESITSLSIPDTLISIGDYAFCGCSNLKTVVFPKFVKVIGWDYDNIGVMAFANCKNLREITLGAANIGEGAFVTGSVIRRLEFFDNQHTSVSEADEVGHFFSTISKIILNDESLFEIYENGTTKKVYVNDSAHIVFSRDISIEKLFVNGVDAVVEGIPGANSVLYTIPAQKKSIRIFRKQCLTYHIKSTDSMKKLTCKKDGKKYRYAWKKVKTTIKTYKYNWDKNKWKKTKKNIATQYQIYGKEKKGDKYQLIKTTKKRKITTKYKYVKVKPVKIWLE